MNGSEARRWLASAEEDLEEATLDLENRRPPRFACFNAEQAAEKALKAAIIASGALYPTGREGNDLDRLVQLVPESWKVATTDADLPMLSQLAVQPRYPDSALELTREDAEQAVSDARRLVEAAETDLADLEATA